MSRNVNKITKALAGKGCQAREMHWDPVGHACEMCGPEGGWYIAVETIAVDEYGDHEYVDTILAYSTAEALEEIEYLPICSQDGGVEKT